MSYIRQSWWFIALLVLPVVVAPFGPYLYPRAMLAINPNETLFYGTCQNDPALVRAAALRGAQIDSPFSYAGRTPLMVASLHGRAEVMQALLAAGADPHRRDSKGLTAAQLAVIGEHPEVVGLLQVARRDP